MRYGLTISALLHVGILILVIVGLPQILKSKRPEIASISVEVVSLEELAKLPCNTKHPPHEREAAEQEMQAAGCGHATKAPLPPATAEQEEAQAVIAAWDRAIKSAMEAAPRKWVEAREEPIDHAPWVTDQVTSRTRWQ